MEGHFEDRGIHLKGKVTKQQVEEELKRALKGIKRPLLIFTGVYEIPTCLTMYEILLQEPLHDITGMVSFILEELHHHMENKRLSEKMASFCKDQHMAKQQVRGSDNCS